MRTIFDFMKLLCTLVLLLFAASASAQYQSKLLHFNAEWKPVKLKEAYYHVDQVKINDTCWEWNYYTAGRPRWLSVQFRDQQGKIWHGKYIVYKDNGYADSSGYYRDGKREGEWYVMASNNQVLKKLEYANGVLMSEKDSTTVKQEREAEAAAALGKQNPEGKSFTKVEIESEFPGGISAWTKYLTKNLRYPQESIKRNATGMVQVQFIVDKEGKITNVEIYRSVEYFIDKEAMRLITTSPNWTPAVQDGRKVKSYKRQPIGFVLQ